MTQFLQQLINGLSIGGNYALVAVGFSLVVGSLRVLNFAHPELLMVGAVTTWFTGAMLEWNFLLAAPIGIVTAAAVGIGIERFAIRPVAHGDHLAPMITTIGVSTMLQHGAVALFGANPRPFPPPITTSMVAIGGVGVPTMQLVSIVVTLAAVLGLVLVLRRTSMGLGVRSIADDPAVARLLGMPVNRIVAGTIAIASALGAVAGILIAISYGQVGPFMAVKLGLKAVVAMLVAGMGRLGGAVVVGFGLGILETMVSAYISSSLRDAVAFAALIAIFAVRPAGIFGRREASL